MPAGIPEQQELTNTDGPAAKTDHKTIYLVMRKMGHVGTQIESVYRLGRTEIGPTKWPRSIKTELKQGSNEREQILHNTNKV